LKQKNFLIIRKLETVGEDYSSKFSAWLASLAAFRQERFIKKLKETKNGANESMKFYARKTQ
jgi:hypothetical protein